MRNNSSFCTLHFALCTDSGFSLVEMMVAIAIFMVVAVVAVAALLKIVDADRKSQTLQDAVNNINFAMDSITREIRVGSRIRARVADTVEVISQVKGQFAIRILYKARFPIIILQMLLLLFFLPKQPQILIIKMAYVT